MPVPQKINKSRGHLPDFSLDVFRSDRRRVVLAFIFVVFAGVLEGIGLTAFLPMLSGLFSKQFQSENLLTKWMPEFLKDGTHLAWLTLFILLIFTAKCVFSYFSKIFVEKVAVNYEIEFKKSIVASFLRSRWEFASEQKSGFLMSLVTEQSVVCGNAVRLVIQFYAELVNTAIYLYLGFTLSFKAFLPTLLLGVVAYFLAKRVIVKSKAISVQMAAKQNSLHGELFEDLVAVKFLKANHLESHRLEQISGLYDDLNKKMFQRFKYGARVDVLPEAAAVIFVCLFLYISCRFFGVPAEAALLMSVIIYRLGRKAMDIQAGRQRLVSCMPFYEVCRKFIDEARRAAVVSGSKKITRFETLELVRVSFAYPNGEAVLRDVSLKINKNQVIAISGSSGSGKTTLLDLLVGLNRPAQGKVLINGIDISEIDIFSWRDSIAYVSQEAMLYDMSVEENLRLGNPGVSRERLEEACRQVGAHEFILAQPKGYATVIGNRGHNLSGGQRQRLVFARALLRDPQFLILDEPTSALDSQSEEVVRILIHNLKGKMNILVVSHRPSLTQDADQAYQIREGCLAPNE